MYAIDHSDPYITYLVSGGVAAGALTRHRITNNGATIAFEELAANTNYTIDYYYFEV